MLLSPSFTITSPFVRLLFSPLSRTLLITCHLPRSLQPILFETLIAIFSACSVTADSTAIAAASALVDTEDSPVPITVDNSDSTANPVDSLSTPLATLDAKDSTSADSAIAIESTTDTTALDSLAIADSTNTDSTVTDSAASAPPPTEFVLDDFVEVELEIGLETSTRIEILSGLEAGERIAADPALIRRKKEEQAKKPKKEEKKGWF